MANNRNDDNYFDSQVKRGMGPYWAIHWDSGIIKRLRTPALDDEEGKEVMKRKVWMKEWLKK